MAKGKMVGEFYVNEHGGVHGPDLYTPVCRIAFVYLVNKNEKFKPAKYGFTLLADKKDPTVKSQLIEIQNVCKKMADVLFGPGKTPAELKFPAFQDGDEKEYEGFPGNWVLVCKNEQRIPILRDVLPESIEAGMLVRAQVQPYLNSDGFSYKARGLALVKDDGVRFNAAPSGTSLLEGLDDAVEASKTSNADASLGDDLDEALGAKSTKPSAKAAKPAGLDVL